MCVDECKDTVLVQLADGVATQFAQFRLVDHFETTVDERLFLTFLLDRHFAVH